MSRLWDGAPPGRRRDDPDTWVGPLPRRRGESRQRQPPPRLPLELPRARRRALDGAPAGHRAQGVGHGRADARRGTARQAGAHPRNLLHPALRRPPAPGPGLSHRRPPLPSRRRRLHRRRAAGRGQLHGLARKPPRLLPDLHLPVPPRQRRGRLREGAHGLQRAHPRGHPRPRGGHRLLAPPPRPHGQPQHLAPAAPGGALRLREDGDRAKPRKSPPQPDMWRDWSDEMRAIPI